jgi:hypothetical protein
MGKRGPRPTGKFSKKGANLGLRVSDDLRRHIAEAAKANKTSLSAEVEARLARSFELDASPTDRSLADMLGAAMNAAATRSGKDWGRDPFTFSVMLTAVTAFLERFKPEGVVAIPDTLEALRYDWPPDMRAALVESLTKDPAKVIEAYGNRIAEELAERLELAARGYVRQDPHGRREQPLEQHAGYLTGLLTKSVLDDGQPTERAPGAPHRNRKG